MSECFFHEGAHKIVIQECNLRQSIVALADIEENGGHLPW